MWTKFKSLPTGAKFLVIILVLGFGGGISNYLEANGDQDRSSELAALQSQLQQLQIRAQPCAAQMTSADAASQQIVLEAALQSMQGTLGSAPLARPPDTSACQSELATITAQEAVVQQRIYQIQTGDKSIPAKCFAGLPDPACVNRQ